MLEKGMGRLGDPLPESKEKNGPTGKETAAL